MNTRATAAFVAAGGFLVRFLRVGAIENDHYVCLARAHQVLHGDWPVRDFVDTGFPLGYLLPALAAVIAGPTLLTEAVLDAGLFAIALAAIVALTRRASGSILIGLLAVTMVLVFPPRLYNSSKMLVPVVAMLLAWAYCDRPSRSRAIALGTWTAIGFLFRHDYGVVFAAVRAVMLVVRHRGEWRIGVDHAATFGLSTLAVASPWLIYVQLQQGLTGYIAAAIRFSLAERTRTVSHWPAIYYVMTVLPAAALLAGIRGTRQLSSAQIAFAALLVLVSDLVLLRDVPGSRLPDVYGTTAIAAAILVGAVRRPPKRAGRAWTPTVVAICAIVAAAATGIGIERASTASGIAGPIARWELVASRLRDARPEVMPNPERAPLVAYIRRWPQVDDRVLVGGFGPELPVLAQRAFAGGLPDWLRGYYEHPDDVARAPSSPANVSPQP